jgi:collagenase-like PrtC family protease
MKCYSVPADFKKETIDAYDRLNHAYPDSRVVETYGNITIGNELESGRPVDILPQVDLTGLHYYVDYSKQRGIDFNYTINASYLGNKEFTKEGIDKIYHFLGNLYQAGVRSLIVTLPSLIEVITWFPYDFHIKGSTIYQVTNVNKALELKKMGIERMVVDESINRNFSVLKRIREAVGDGIEIIVNSICHKDCSYRMFHYNQIAGDSIEVSSGCSNSYYPHKCLLRRYENSSNLLKLTWVRPEDIKYYTGIGIHYFKLQGRPRVLKGDPVRAVEAYFKEDYQGDLFELLDLFAPVSSFRVPVENKKLDGFIKHFYDNPDFCRRDCAACRYCESFAKKIIDAETLEKVYRLAREYYSRLDPVKENVDAVIAACSQREDIKLIAEDTIQDEGDFTL